MTTAGAGPEMPPIRFESFVAAPVERVYDALTTSWDGWFTSQSWIDARPGGRYRFHWEAFGPSRVRLTLQGPVLEADGPRRFVFKWGDEGSSPADMTEVAFDLTPRGGGTVIGVTERGYGRDESQLLASLHSASGWGEALTLLKFYLEHGVTYGPVPPP